MVMNPGMMGISQEQLQQAQVIGQHIRAATRRDPATGSVQIKLVPRDKDELIGDRPAEEVAVQMVKQLTDQLYQLFGIVTKEVSEG